MTLSRRLIEQIAICSSRVSANNYFSVTAKDVDSVGIEAGEEVRVILIRTDLEGDLKPRDRDIYTSKLQKSNQVYIPADTRDKLDLETGDIVKYLVMPKDTFPSLMDGPIRGAARDFLEIQEEPDETPVSEDDRPTRETTSAEFSASMQKTGQITVPKDVRERMGLLQGDMVLATIQWLGEDISANKDIGTGNRITINKDEREELGLEPGDEPTIRLAVFG
jgi:bifunctional DNA-binding transcriptional regulator/antitoxin component of YhaV-PrlF toxin-antitoxin module